MRFELVDQVIQKSPQAVTAIKNVTAAEEYLADHFPSFPVLPGVMMLEALVQAARHLLDGRADTPMGPWVLAEVRNLRYGNMVRPGQQLWITVELSSVEDNRFTFKGLGNVDQSVAVQGKFTLRPVARPAASNPR